MTLQTPTSEGLLEITTSSLDDRAVVTLIGELDAATAPSLYRQLAELTRRGLTMVDLDLTELRTMDSSGLSVLVSEHKRAHDGGGRLLVLHPNRQIIRLFRTSGLMSYLNVHPRMSI